MPEHPNAAVVRELFAAFDREDMSALGALMSDDVVWHQIGAPPIRGKAALAAEPPGTGDYKITAKLHDVLASDEHAIALVEATGTRGGRTLQYNTAEIYHLRDGRVTERWAFSDDTAAIAAFFA